MWLIRAAMRRPITILIVIVGVALMSWLAIQRMKVDIFPSLGTPVIYVAQPYGGMDPAQMEGYIANYYEYHFLYVTGIEHVESKSIQGATLLKLFFHEGTNMSQEVAETVAQESGIKVGGALYADDLSDPSGPAPDYLSLMRYNAQQLLVGMQ